jgi:hypothetical protein
MSHVTKEVPWCTIDVDTAEGRVVLLEKWQYTWLVDARSTARWTLTEKQEFHRRVDREIWAAWSNRAFLQVTGASEFAKRFSGRMVPVYTDVRWVLAKPHWTVMVTKTDKGKNPRSSTNWWARKITLDSNDVTVRTRLLGPSKDIIVSQVPVAHEFGHTIGNVAPYARGDEYESDSDHTADIQSIMNRGVQLRVRHFDQILMDLNGMIEGTTFAVGRLQ